jgi:tRNA threonylcarbamoyladenosine biosynthesis protein TsaB
MRTLAIDTSLAAGSISACGTDLSIERTLPIPGAHARLVAAALRDAAGELGWDIGTAELVAVVRGPGSFTGLRVGVALAKGIAWACGARLVGVSGFETIAWKSDRAIELLGRPLEIAYDAGRGDVYAAPATPCGTAASGWTVGPPRIVRAESWIATLPAAAVVAGPALAVLAERLSVRPDVAIAPASCWTAGAAAAAAIAGAESAAGRTDDPALLVPDYLRPSYAEDRG